MTINPQNYSCKDLPYTQELIRIRRFMESQHVVSFAFPFPRNACDHTSRVVARIIGAHVIPGHVLLDSAYIHTLNYDPQRKIYIDLTRSQFGVNIPPIVITSSIDPSFIPLEPHLAKLANQRIDTLLHDSIDTLAKAYAEFGVVTLGES